MIAGPRLGALEYRHRPRRHQRGRRLHLFHSVLGSTRLYSFENQWTTYQNGVDMHRANQNPSSERRLTSTGPAPSRISGVAAST
jgi:hypothetical protein